MRAILPSFILNGVDEPPIAPYVVPVALAEWLACN